MQTILLLKYKVDNFNGNLLAVKNVITIRLEVVL